MILGQLINSIMYDLKFTTENQSEYDDNFLPTLDFKLKLEDVGDTINSTRSPLAPH